MIAATTLTTSSAEPDSEAVEESDNLAPGEEQAPVVDPAGPVTDGTAIPPGAVPAELIQVARGLRHRPVQERIVGISERMLDVPYLVNPIGEGDGHDPDPFARYDVHDCLTFVEEVLALSLAGDPAHAGSVRLGLRYGDQDRTYAGRRHFMELQWIPGAVEDGWLIPTTDRYGETARMARTVDEETWRSWRGLEGFGLEVEELPVGEMALDVLPLETARSVVGDLKPGSILMVVREDQPWRGPLWVTHVGFVVSSDDGPRLRHATKMSGRVRDHGLAWYLEHIGTYVHRPTAGVVIYEAVEQIPRRVDRPVRIDGPRVDPATPEPG